MTTELPEPKSRKESYLAKAAGMDVTIPEKPLSRFEQYLDAIAEGGGGGGGGTSDFNELDNRPKYNGTAMTGDTNIPVAPSFFNIADIVQAAYEDPDVQKTITLQEYEAVQEACMNFLPLSFCHTEDGLAYEFAIFPDYECTSNESVTVYGETVPNVMGNFLFEYNDEQPSVLFNPVQ